MDIAKYEARKCETLLRFGFPNDQLWLTEVERTDDGRGVVYYHESGNIHGIQFFDDNMQSFWTACRELVRSLFGDNFHTVNAELELKRPAEYEAELAHRDHVLGSDMGGDAV